ncbi:sulfatase-like hydrolase/transferase [Verrucomicrobiaceae bacterium N1E253]|uniref:Sulfatase-like hydrolase/transferase n=2 Tax=Oceaniferula marina TaxID=2748318 RepID=A0A851GBR3_9BACT|nr:sulfatase-like hydrolase/transferase [Oceaniferula marina]
MYKISIVPLFGVLLCLNSAAAEQTSSNQPNVVLILADDMRLDYLACMGMNQIVQTPNLDKLATKGTLFTHGFVTSAACTPSRASIMSGQYERRHGVTFGSDSAMTEKAFSQTYPMLLKQAGYYCGYIGKNHVPIGSSKRGTGYKSGHMDSQFDFWYGGHGHLGFYPKQRHKIFRHAKADTQIEILQQGTDQFFAHNPEFAKTQSFLQSRPKNRPFSLQVNFNLPHGAGTGSMKLKPSDPALYRSAYRDQIHAMPQPDTYIAKKDIRVPRIPRHVYNGKYISQYNYVQTPNTLRERQVRTCQTVTGIDQLVGKLMATLEKQGIADNTIIIFTSDHGLQHGEHGLGGKVLLYEESLHIPLIVYDPRIKKDRAPRVEQLALSVDLAPTILDLAGLPIPEIMQGRSLKPLLQGDSHSWRQDFFCENMFMGQNYPRMEAVRSSEWKYIRYFDKKKDQHHILSLVASIRGEKPIYEELFNLKVDSGETHNLAPNPKYQSTLEKYRQRCDQLVRKAKGGNLPPDTHVKAMENPTYKAKLRQRYEGLNL